MDNIPPGISIYRQWRSWWPILVIALSVVQASLLLNAQSGAHLRTYSNLVNFLHLLLVLLAAGLATRNALGSRRAIRLFWSLVALGCVFWALSSLSWIYYVAIRSQDHPAFLFEAFPLHFLLIFMIAAVASRPHLHFARHGPYRTTLNLLLLLFLWVFAYAFALLPISHLQVGAELLRRAQILYVAESLLLLGVVAAVVAGARPPWRALYGQLLGASALYALGSLAATRAMAGGMMLAGWYTVPYTLAACWFVWVVLRGGELAPQLAQSFQTHTANPKYASTLATLVVTAIPVVGMWELFRADQLYAARVIRLVIVFLALLFLAVTAFATEYLTKLDLRSDVEAARERLQMAMTLGKSVGWDWDLTSGRDIWFGDLQTVFGISSETFVGRAEDFFRYLHPDDRQRISEAVSDARVSRKPYAAEYRLVQQDGSARWVRATGKFYYSKSGTARRMLGMAVDITEYKTTETALKKSEEKFSKAFRRGPMALTLTSAQDHRYLDVNETFERITGWQREEVVGRTPIDIGIWVDPDERTTFVKRLVEEVAVHDLEVRFRCKSGEERLGLCSAELIQIEGEACALSAIVDITDRRRAEEALHRKEAELTEAQHLAQLGSWQWDPKDRVSTWSEELYHIHGLDPKLPAPTPQELKPLFTPESWERLRATMEAAAQTGTIETLDLEVLHPDGGKRWVTSRGRTIRDPSGQIVSIRGTAQDITERKRIEEQLREKDVRLDAVVRSAMDAIIAVDEQQSIVLFNDSAEKMFGCAAVEALGTDINRFIPQRFRSEHPGHIRRFGETGVANRAIGNLETLWGLRATGEKFPIEASISHVEANGKKLLTVIVRDITERRRMEGAQRLSEERLHLAVQAGKMYAYEWDAASDMIFRSPEYVDVVGTDTPMQTSRLEMIAQVHPDDRESVRDHFTRTTPSQISYRLQRPDGSLIWLERSAQGFFDDNGKLLRMVGVVADITDRKVAEQRLRESEERFRLVANTAPVLIWMSGVDKLCTYFNDPWLHFIGRPLEAELGNGWTENVHPEDLSECMRTYSQATDLRLPFQMQYRLRRHDGEYRWVTNMGVPRFNPDGSFAGYIGSCVDISDAKLAEEALASVGRRLIEAHEEERAWIARELHDDINQRVALLTIDLERFNQQIPSGPADLRGHIQHARQGLMDISKDLQALSHRLHSSKLEYLGIVAAAGSFCKELADQHGLQVEFEHRDIPTTIPAEVSLCLFRILQEALHNAARHSGAAQFRVELYGAAHEIRLKVSDQGVGFDWKAVMSGPGLGLISMRERVQLVKGEFSIESAHGRGTTIEARIPLPREEHRMSRAG